MIISCVNCNKKFNLDEKLIPEKGRLLQCGSCQHKWHYKLIKTKENQENHKKINKDDDIKIKINPSIDKINEQNTTQEIIVNNPKNLKNKSKNSELKKKQIKKSKTSADLLSILIVSIISFIALILILDSFKLYLSVYFPSLPMLLENFYKTLFDVISFIKDLIS